MLYPLNQHFIFYILNTQFYANRHDELTEKIFILHNYKIKVWVTEWIFLTVGALKIPPYTTATVGMKYYFSCAQMVVTFFTFVRKRSMYCYTVTVYYIVYHDLLNYVCSNDFRPILDKISKMFTKIITVYNFLRNIISFIFKSSNIPFNILNLCVSQ